MRYDELKKENERLKEQHRCDDVTINDMLQYIAQLERTICAVRALGVDVDHLPDCPDRGGGRCYMNCTR